MKAGKLIIEVAFSLVALSGTAQDKAFTASMRMGNKWI